MRKDGEQEIHSEGGNGVRGSQAGEVLSGLHVKQNIEHRRHSKGNRKPLLLWRELIYEGLTHKPL